MKTSTGILIIMLVLGLLVVPGVSAADNNSTDPNLDNNQANVTVDPYSEPSEVTNTTTIPLQKTGVPITGVLTATLSILAGMGLAKRK